MSAKSQDYAEADDPFRNLRQHGRLGIAIRLYDKICRLDTLSRREAAVADESARDTVLDVINYAVLWLEIGEEG